MQISSRHPVAANLVMMRGACLAPLVLLTSSPLRAHTIIAVSAATARALRDTALVHEVPGRFSAKLVGGDGLGAAPPGLRAPMHRNVDSIVALVRRDPAIAPPKGVDVVVHTYVGHDTTLAGRAIATGYIKGFLWPQIGFDEGGWVQEAGIAAGVGVGNESLTGKVSGEGMINLLDHWPAAVGSVSTSGGGNVQMVVTDSHHFSGKLF